MQLLIPVAAGLESVVKRQLFSLGFSRAPAFNGRIETEGDWTAVARLNVFLRSGERVLVKLAEFPAVTFDELYDRFYEIPWEDWLRVDSRILMDGKSAQSALAAVKAAADLHYKMSDEIVNLVKRSEESGEPIVRCLEYNYPGQGYKYVKDEFMLGEDILVCPVVTPGTFEKEVVIPCGKWQDEDGRIFEGGKKVTVKTPLEKLFWLRRIDS